METDPAGLRGSNPRASAAALALVIPVVAALLFGWSPVAAAPSLELAIAGADDGALTQGVYQLSLRVVDGTSDQPYRIDLVEADPGLVLTRSDIDLSEDGRQSAPLTLIGDQAVHARGLIVPSTASGDYRIRARVGGGDLREPLAGELQVSVVRERSSPIEAVIVSLGPVGHSPRPHALTDHWIAESNDDLAPPSHADCVDANPDRVGAQPHPNCIAVVVEVRGADGLPAQRHDVQVIEVNAPFATVLAGPTPGAAPLGDGGGIRILLADTPGGPDEQQTLSLFDLYVVRAAPGPVSVTALAGGAGFARSAPLRLAFVGDPVAIELAAVGGPLEVGGVASAEVTGLGADGEPARLRLVDQSNPVSAAVIDDRGNQVEAITATVAAHQRNPSALTIELQAGAEAVPGSYQLRVSFADEDADAEPLTTPLTVIGAPTKLSLDLSQPEDSRVITLTATLTDSVGRPAPDARTIEFQVYGDLELAALDGDGDDGAVRRQLSDGRASSRYVITGEVGAATVIASVLGRSDLQASVAITPVGLDCLSSLSDLAVWTCPVELAASELFPLLADDGASSVHLWDGAEWVRYTAVDGVPHPSARDFTVGQHAILFVSR